MSIPADRSHELTFPTNGPAAELTFRIHQQLWAGWELTDIYEGAKERDGFIICRFRIPEMS